MFKYKKVDFFPSHALTISIGADIRIVHQRQLPRTRRQYSGCSGFTLIEIMAAITIFFMVIGILVSGVAQAMRLAEFSQNSTATSRDAAIRIAWFRETVGLTIIPGYSPEPLPTFTGTERTMSGLTLQSLNTDSAGPGGFVWSLVFNSRTNETELQYQNKAQHTQQFRIELNPAGNINDTFTAFAWPGSNGRFRYLDEGGNWRERWPAEILGAHAHDAKPPLAVGLDYGNDSRMLVVNIQNRTVPLPSLNELMR